VSSDDLGFGSMRDDLERLRAEVEELRQENERLRAANNALLDANIAHRAASERFDAVRRRSGQRTVSLDNDGNLIEIAVDGTTRRL
jgi:regulator of replication initiation timing